MHPRLQELVDRLAAERQTVLDAADRVPAALRDRRPAPDRWSVAEVLAHLARVERGVARLAAMLIDEGRAAGLGPETSTASVLGVLDHAGLRDRSHRVEAPDRVAPDGATTAEQARAALSTTRSSLLEALARGDGLALGTLRRAHPVLGELDLYAWLLFVAEHEARHAAQIDEVGAALGAVHRGS